jgi:hypothetical protein
MRRPLVARRAKQVRDGRGFVRRRLERRLHIGRRLPGARLHIGRQVHVGRRHIGRLPHIGGLRHIGGQRHIGRRRRRGRRRLLGCDRRRLRRRIGGGSAGAPAFALLAIALALLRGAFLCRL